MRPDYTDKYNTKLTPEQEADFQKAFPKTSDLYDYDLRGAWKAGETKAANGHLSDKFKKPNHPTFSNESIYHGVDGNKGGSWVGSDKEGWSFKASDTNMKNMSPSELQGYFKRVEPDTKLILPGGAATNDLLLKSYP